MKDLKWQGSVGQYVQAVTASGIPPTGAFDEVHAAWSNRYGGPLRDDEIQNVAAYILNWAKSPITDGAIIDAPKPGAGAAPKATAVPLTAAQEAGKQVYLKAGCAACHSIKGMAGGGAIGPNLSNVATNAETRIKDAGYTGAAKTAADYIKESVLEPAKYLVPQCPSGPCPAGVMPATFGTTLKPEEITQLVDYLSTLK
jgi:mono/diheme cytochrome c family protein